MLFALQGVRFMSLIIHMGQNIFNNSNIPSTYAPKSSYEKVDEICDYIPFVSTATNLMDLFQKCVLEIRGSNESGFVTEFYQSHQNLVMHLTQKSFTRCIILLIPILGNIVIGIYDLWTLVKVELFLLAISTDREVQSIFEEKERKEIIEDFKDDKPVILAAVRRDVGAYYHASQRLKEDEDVVLAGGPRLAASLKAAASPLNAVITVLESPKIVAKTAKEAIKGTGNNISKKIKGLFKKENS
jgi:hypothetical protein